MTDPRGRMIDIGGRRLRLVAAGPETGAPIVLLEAGSYGFSADWAVVQERLAERGLRSLAYDRAGLGLSDAGPAPRDGESVLSDLEALLGAAGEPPPYIAVGHSMAGLRVQLLTARHPDWIEGVVLVDATTPQATDAASGRLYLWTFRTVSRLFTGLARAGLLNPLARWADAIGLSEAARVEKQSVFPLAGHNRAALNEVEHWQAAADQARAAGSYDSALPLAVVTAGRGRANDPIGAIVTAPARAATVAYVKHVEGAAHATLLGTRFADEIVAAVLFVRDEAAKTKAAGSPRRPSKSR